MTTWSLLPSLITDPVEFSCERVMVKHFFTANLDLNKIEVTFAVR